MKRLFSVFAMAVAAVIAGIVPSFAQQLAFPGAEGFGKYTTGGRLACPFCRPERRLRIWTATVFPMRLNPVSLT